MKKDWRWTVAVFAWVMVTTLGLPKSSSAADAELIKEMSKSMWDEKSLSEEIKDRPKSKFKGWVDISPLQLYWVRYEEDFSISDTKSDWDTIMFRGDIGVGLLYELDETNYIGPEAQFGLFYTQEEDEDFKGDAEVSTPKRFDGYELKLGVTWEHVLNPQVILRPISISYVIREIDFRRKEKDVPTADKISETNTLRYLEYSPLISFIRDRLKINFRPAFGWILENESRSSGNRGTTKGDGGYLWRAELKVAYQFLENLEGYVSGLYEFQFQEGDIDGDFEWGDNEMQTYGVMLGVNIPF